MRELALVLCACLLSAACSESGDEPPPQDGDRASERSQRAAPPPTLPPDAGGEERGRVDRPRVDMEDVGAPEAVCSEGPLWGDALAEAVERRAMLERYTWEGPAIEAPGFTHSVASGDPRHDRVILWTRFEADAGGAPLDIHWEVASGSHFVDAERWASAVAGRPAAIEKWRSRRA